MPRTLALIAGLLILYGSWYPFDFIEPTATTWHHLWFKFSLWSSPGDVLGNVALFVPFGWVCRLALRDQGSALRAASLTLAGGLVLAVVAQIGQAWVPSRDPTLTDVLWNMVGCALGMLPTHRNRAAQAGAGTRQAITLAPLLVVGIVLVECLPLVPSLDWALIKAQLKSLWVPAAWDGAAVADHAGLQWLLGWALLHRLNGLRLGLAHGALMLLLIVAKVFLVQAPLDSNVVVGSVAGLVGWWALWWGTGRQDAQHSAAGLVLALVLVYTLGALAPFEWRDHPTPMGWLPMAALLKGQMLANSRNLLTSLVLFAGILGAARAAGARARGSVIALALWTLCLEGLQCWITPRSGDITTPLLVLLAGAGLALLQAPAAGAGQPRPAPTLGRQDDAAGPSPSEPARKPVHPLWLIGPAVTAMALGISWGLHRPGIPYNVVDLFRGHAHPAALVAFALALLWLGAGPAWLGRWVAASSKPWLVLPLGALACSLVALALTWSAVTTESIEDVAGSANLVWFVTQRDIWGVAWRHIFLALNQPAVIGFLEHCVRWSALYGPAPLVLGSLIALQAQATRPTRSTRTTALWLLAGGLTLWLCKGIAFDWSSTDNLNELIARDGPWGWGGGGYLYGLLGLLCVNSWLLGRALTRGVGWLAGALLLSALAMPLGWALLNEGLNPAVQKYDLVYSGVQFLLGPDRKHLLSTEVLMLRWFGLQAATVLVVASGIWMEHCVWRWRSAQASTAG